MSRHIDKADVDTTQGLSELEEAAKLDDAIKRKRCCMCVTILVAAAIAAACCSGVGIIGVVGDTAACAAAIAAACCSGVTTKLV